MLSSHLFIGLPSVWSRSHIHARQDVDIVRCSCKVKKLRYTAEVARIGGHYRFKVIQGHRFGDFGTNRKLICSFVLVIILTYILSFTASKLYKIIGLICAFDGATSFNTIVRGERLNSEPRNLASKSRNIALSCGAERVSIARTV